MKIFPMFLLRILTLQFISLIHFELIFIYYVRERSTSFFCMWKSSCSRTVCWRDCPFPIELSWYHCWKSIDHICNFFWALNSIPLVYMSVLMPIPQCFDYCSFVVSFEIRKCESSNFVLLFQYFYVWVYFWIVCSVVLIYGPVLLPIPWCFD